MNDEVFKYYRERYEALYLFLRNLEIEKQEDYFIGRDGSISDMRLLDPNSELYKKNKEIICKIPSPVDDKRELYDKYPIYICWGSFKPIRSARTGLRLSGYHDSYWNIGLRAGLDVGPIDKHEFGKKRIKFKKANEFNIIVPDKSVGRYNQDFYNEVRDDFLINAFINGQEHAHQYILSKYNKWNY